VLNVWAEERRYEQTLSNSYTLILFLFRFFSIRDLRPLDRRAN